jgi:hypothetical protein
VRCIAALRICRDQLRAEGKDHKVEAMLCAMEDVWGTRFEDGLNPELQYLDHLQVGGTDAGVELVYSMPWYFSWVG